MKYVWFVQDYNQMDVNEVFTTKKAAWADAKKYGEGRFKEMGKDVYYYNKIGNTLDTYCIVKKVPVIKAKRK